MGCCKVLRTFRALDTMSLAIIVSCCCFAEQKYGREILHGLSGFIVIDGRNIAGSSRNEPGAIAPFRASPSRCVWFYSTSYSTYGT